MDVSSESIRTASDDLKKYAEHWIIFYTTRKKYDEEHLSSNYSHDVNLEILQHKEECVKLKMDALKSTIEIRALLILKKFQALLLFVRFMKSQNNGASGSSRQLDVALSRASLGSLE
ncbi:hypothetical protein ABG067_001484 [Albugo candida]